MNKKVVALVATILMVALSCGCVEEGKQDNPLGIAHIKHAIITIHRQGGEATNCEPVGEDIKPKWDIKDHTSWKDFEWYMYGESGEGTLVDSRKAALTKHDRFFIKWNGENSSSVWSIKLKEVKSIHAIIVFKLIAVKEHKEKVLIHIKNGEVVCNGNTIKVEPRGKVELYIVWEGQCIADKEGHKSFTTTFTVTWAENYWIK